MTAQIRYVKIFLTFKHWILFLPHCLYVIVVVHGILHTRRINGHWFHDVGIADALLQVPQPKSSNSNNNSRTPSEQDIRTQRSIGGGESNT